MKQALKETIILTRIKCDDLISGFLGYFIENKTLYIVMPYNSEPTLESKLSNLKKDELDLFTKYTWCNGLAFGLDYLHLHNQTHKKIYPKNIFFRWNRLLIGEIGLTVQVLENKLFKINSKEKEEENALYYPNEFYRTDFSEFKLSFDIW